MNNYNLATTNITSLPMIKNSNDLPNVKNLSEMYFLCEYKQRDDSPINGKVNLDFIFNRIIDEAAKNPLNKLDIKRQIVLDGADFQAKNNAEMIDELFKDIDKTIHYNILANSKVETVDDLKNLMDSIIVDFTNTAIASTNLNINNLCITRRTFREIIPYINAYVNKFYRNILQLIRVKRDWRLYGPGTTIYGDNLKLAEHVKKQTTVPSECFINYNSAYIAGKKPYEDETQLASIVRYSDNLIAPNSIFTASEHTHYIQFNITKSEIGPWEIGPWTPKIEYGNNDLINHTIIKFEGGIANNSYGLLPEYPNGSWSVIANGNHRSLSPDSGEATAKANVSVNVRYNGGYKYLKSAGGSLGNVVLDLPYYSTFFWQWIKDDPTEFIKLDDPKDIDIILPPLPEPEYDPEEEED